MNDSSMNISINGHEIRRVRNARSWHQRLVGLLTTKKSAFRGIVINPCNSIHTIGMRYPIDVVFADNNHVVVRVFKNVRPFKFCLGGRNARYTVELPIGSIEKYDINAGNSFQLNVIN